MDELEEHLSVEDYDAKVVNEIWNKALVPRFTDPDGCLNITQMKKLFAALYLAEIMRKVPEVKL